MKQEQQEWAERFDYKFDLADIIIDDINPAYISYRGCEFSSVDNLLYDIKSFIAEEIQKAREEAVEKLSNYIEHTGRCIRNTFEAGEPTVEGGYRQKFDGKWYQSKPIDETPKCDCGLVQALTDLTNNLTEK